MDGRDAKSVEPMGYLIEIVCHPRNAANELHIFGFDTTLYLCFGDELSQELCARHKGFTSFALQGVILHRVESKQYLIFSFFRQRLGGSSTLILLFHNFLFFMRPTGFSLPRERSKEVLRYSKHKLASQ